MKIIFISILLSFFIFSKAQTYNDFLSSGDNNWGTAGNWSQGTVPTATDGFITRFTATSMNCTASGTKVCNALDMSAYTNTLTLSNGVTVSGNITLGSGMNLSGTGSLTVNANATLISNGFIWPNTLIFATASTTYTISGNWTNTGVVQIASVSTIAINKTTNEKLICAGGFQNSTTGTGLTGTIDLKLTGGIWNGTGVTKVNLEFAGNVTMTSLNTLYYNTGTISYTSGTITVTSNTLICADNATFNTSGMNFNNVTFTGASKTITLSSNLNMIGTLTDTRTGTSAYSGAYTINCGAININGGTTTITIGTIVSTGTLTTGTGGTTTTLNTGTITCVGISLQSTCIIAGTATINWSGGTWSQVSTGILKLNLTIIGDVTISGNVYYNTGTFARTSGTITSTSSTINVADNMTFDLTGGTINNITSTTAGKIWTLKSELKIAGAMTRTTSTSASHGTFVSNVGGTKRLLTFISGSSYDLSFIDFTDIDASNGLTILTYKGTVSNCTNVSTLPVMPVTHGYIN